MRTPTKSSTKKDYLQGYRPCTSLKRANEKSKRQYIRAEKWRTLYYELKRSLSLTKVRYHSYPLELIWLAICMQTLFNISLRGVSHSLTQMGSLLGLSVSNISPSTIRNWNLKFGLYSLNDPISQGKYVLIGDESISLGRVQLMLLLLVPLSCIEKGQALCMKDVIVLGLKVQASWKAAELAIFIEEKKVAGVDIVYALSDKGYNLRKAFKLLNIKWIEDCTHAIANHTKALFKQGKLDHFIGCVNKLRSKWSLSKYQIYAPPKLRAKGRFTQVFALYKWSQFILDQWEDLPLEAQEALSFIKEEQELVQTFEQLYKMINQFCKQFKTYGITKKSMQNWEGWLAKYRKKQRLNKESEQFAERMQNYLQKQKKVLPKRKVIACCSDIIESMFGKYKNKGGNQLITDDVLKIAAYGKEINQNQVQQAMTNIKMEQVLKWKRENTTRSKLALIKEIKKNRVA